MSTRILMRYAQDSTGFAKPNPVRVVREDAQGET